METLASSKRSLQKDPQYFGVFANMARHNVYNILCEIAERTGTNRPGSEDNMWRADVIACLNNEGNNNNRNLPDIQRRVVEKLTEYFRFLKALNITLDAANPDYGMYYKVMRSFLEQLDNTRNQLSHAIHEQTLFNVDLINWMEYIFDDGLKVLRTRVTLEDKKLSHIKRFDGLETVRDEHGKKVKKPKRNDEFKHAFYADEKITEKGITFFTCLFLEQE